MKKYLCDNKQIFELLLYNDFSGAVGFFLADVTLVEKYYNPDSGVAQHAHFRLPSFVETMYIA